MLQVDFLSGSSKEQQENQRTECPGDQGRDRNTCRSQMQGEDTDRIADDIDNVDNNRGFQRNGGISHGAEQRGTGVINSKEREGECRDQEIDQSILHNILLNSAEEKAKERLLDGDGKKHHKKTECQYGNQKLRGRVSGLLRALCTDVLRGDDRTPCCQCGENSKNQIVDHVDQRNAGDSCFTDC